MIFAVHSFYGVYLDLQLARFRSVPKLSKTERWDPANYAVEAEPWVVRNRRWERWQMVVWLGCAFGGPLVALLWCVPKPRCVNGSLPEYCVEQSCSKP